MVYQSLIELIFDCTFTSSSSYSTMYQSLIELIFDKGLEIPNFVKNMYQSLIELIFDNIRDSTGKHISLVSISYRVDF